MLLWRHWLYSKNLVKKSICASAWISRPAAACGAPIPAARSGAAWGILTLVPTYSRPTSRARSPCTRSPSSWPTRTSPAPASCQLHHTQPTLETTDCTRRARVGTRGLTGSSTPARPGWERPRPAHLWSPRQQWTVEVVAVVEVEGLRWTV